MSVLELPPPSHAWSFVRGIAVGLALAAGGAGAFLALSHAHVVMPSSRSQSSAPVASTAPDDLTPWGHTLVDAARKHGVTLDDRMLRASDIYFAADRAHPNLKAFWLMLWIQSVDDFSKDKSVPFNDRLADWLVNINAAGAIGAPSPLPEAQQRAVSLLRDMDFE